MAEADVQIEELNDALETEQRKAQEFEERLDEQEELVETLKGKLARNRG